MTTKISEKSAFNLLQAFPSQDIENSLFKEGPISRMMSILEMVEISTKERLGTGTYSLDTNDIVEGRERLMEDDGTPLGQHTIYRYLKSAETVGLIWIERKVISVHQETILVRTSPGEIPSIMLLDPDGNEIPPSDLSGGINARVFIENGERTLKAFRMTKKGEALMKKWRDANGTTIR